MSNIYEKLSQAREKFHQLKLTKTGHNKYADYKYFELGDFLIPALKVFREVGLIAVVSFDKDTARMEITDIGAPMTNSGANRQFITITSPMGSAALKGCHEVQNIGAVETYQRRYLWVAALEIVEHDAVDSTEPLKEEKRERGGVATQVLDTSPPLSDARKEVIERLAGYVKSDFEAYGPETAYERIELEGLDNLEKIYLGTLLPSNVRNPITAHSRSIHKREKASA
jgi:hypothetical protein